MKTFDFNNPEDARKFLTGFRMPNGSIILYIEDENGTRINLSEAADETVCIFASKIYADLYNKPGSRCYYEEPTIN